MAMRILAQPDNVRIISGKTPYRCQATFVPMLLFIALRVIFPADALFLRGISLVLVGF
jgi:hypothetical protein